MGGTACNGWRFWTVWRVKEGKITYHHGYSVREDAGALVTAARG